MGKFILIFFFGLLLSAPSCVHKNYEFHSNPLSIKCTDLEGQVEGAVETGLFCDSAFTCTEWWGLFGDPQLSRLIEAGLECHPSIQIAEARIRESAEFSLKEASILYPQINFEPAIWRHRVPQFASIPPPELGIFTEATVRLIGTWDLDIWNRNRSLYYAALDDVHAAWADKRAAELLLTTTIAGVYFDIQTLLLRVDLARAQLKEKQRVYGLLKEQFDHGIIDAFFLYQTDTQIALIQDALALLEEALANSNHALAALVGNACCDCNGEGEMLVPPSAHFSEKFPLPCSLPFDLLARRPEITARRWRIEGAGFRINSAQAEFYPNINLYSFFSFTGLKLAKLFQAQSLDILGEAIGHLPIFRAGQLQANLGVRREEFEIAVEEYNGLILDAVQDVSDWLTAFTTADKRLQLIERSLTDAEKLRNLTSERFQRGIADLLSVLNAEINVLIQKDLEAQVQLARLQGVVGLIRAIGGGYNVE